ncbi:MAG: hypothetical protein P8Z41_01070, partial [Anaerolineales bacterium]
GAMKNSPNLELAKDFITFVALDEENLTNWALGVYTNDYLAAIDPDVPEDQAQPGGDFVSSQVVVKKITPEFDSGDIYDWLGGQNNYRQWSEAAPNVSGALLTGSDDAIQRPLESARDEYLSGNITIDQMWEQWLEQVRNLFPDLIIPEPPTME